MEETYLDFAGSCFFFLGGREGEGKLCLAWVIDFGRKSDRIVFHGRVELSM